MVAYDIIALPVRRFAHLFDFSTEVEELLGSHGTTFDGNDIHTTLTWLVDGDRRRGAEQASRRTHTVKTCLRNMHLNLPEIDAQVPQPLPNIRSRRTYWAGAH